jgi:hypothetical protein
MSQECLVSFGDALVSCGNALVSFDDDRMPPHCVILEYFQEGFRRGSKSINDIFTSIGTESPSSFKVSSSAKFGNAVPFARFDGTGNMGFPTIYDYGGLVDPDAGYTVEFWLRQSSTGGWVRKYMMLLNSDRAHNYIEYCAMPSYTSEYLRGYTPTSGSWSWGYGRNVSSSWLNWHHIAYVIYGHTIQLYTDGTLNDTVTNWKGPPLPAIGLQNYLCDANAYNTKYGYYDLCQLTVWDYRKYSGNSFVLPDMLYIDTI